LQGTHPALDHQIESRRERVRSRRWCKSRDEEGDLAEGHLDLPTVLEEHMQERQWRWADSGNNNAKRVATRFFRKLATGGDNEPRCAASTLTYMCRVLLNLQKKKIQAIKFHRELLLLS
jgi:hypothetical protein